jgi:glycosyltransferase involved in cell wall biosynthesis
MPVYVDVSAAVHSRAGLGRYAASLVEALDAHAPAELALFYNRDRAIRTLSGLSHLPRRTVHAGYKPWRMAVWMGQYLGIGFDRLVPDADLFHATEHLLPPLKRCPTVLTVHDLIYHLFPQHHKRLNYWFLNAAMPLFCRRADALIAISEATKRDIVAYHDVAAEKITVIPEAAAPHFRPASPEAVEQVRTTYHLPTRYMLHVGTIEPRKNLKRVIQALERMCAQGLEAHLVIVGSKGWLFEPFFAALERSPAREAVILPGYVSDADLPAVYTGATLTVMSSVYEGFGLPILESMACGTPVVSSGAASLPELGGDAARYFDPYDVEEMTTQLSAVWQDVELREAMRTQGLAQAARFSWARAAQETWTLYQRLLSS